MIRLLVRRTDLNQLYCTCVKELVFEDGFLWWHEELPDGVVDVLQISVNSFTAIPILSRALEVGFVDLSSFAAEEVTGDE